MTPHYFSLFVCSYNKTEDDFNTADEYNDYLESLENLSASRASLWVGGSQ